MMIGTYPIKLFLTNGAKSHRNETKTIATTKTAKTVGKGEKSGPCT